MVYNTDVDRGWSWIILIACCFIEFMYIGLMKSLSVLLPFLTDQFQTHTWIIGTSITLIGSIKDFTSPIVGFLSSYVDSRYLGLVGGLLIGLSTTCASLVSDVRLLVLFWSVFNGIGFALVKLPATFILSQYFDDFYPLASGIFYASGSIGFMVFAPFAQVLLEAYGWRGTLLLLGAINFNFFACCAVFKPHSSKGYLITRSHIDDNTTKFSGNKKEKSTSIEHVEWKSKSVKPQERDHNTWTHLFGLYLFTNFAFVASSLAMATFVASIIGWTVYFIPRCLTKGLTPYESTFAASLAGFSNLLGHFVYLPFLKKNTISTRGAIYISGLTAGIVLFLDKFTSTFVATTVTNSIITCGIGVINLLDVHMKAVIDQDSLTKAFGWRTAVCGLVGTIPGFTVGWIYEQTSSYDGGFFFIGALPLVSISVIGLDHLLEKGICRRKCPKI